MNEDDKACKVLPKPRSKKLNPRIDMTAMVSVSFLLIIFFMVAKELARPQSMSLGKPDIGCGIDDGIIRCGVGSERVVTLLLDDDNKVIAYWGLLTLPNEQPKKFNYGKDGIRKVLLRMNAQIQQHTGNTDRGAIVIIKPSKKSNFGNLVDALDEMAITEIPTYAVIDDFTPEESKLLASK